MVRLNRIDTEKYRQMQENKTRERKAKKILSELGIKTASKPYQSGPFIPFEPFDDGYDNPEEFRNQPMYHFPPEGGQGEFLFPFVQKENVKDLFIAQNESTGGKLGKPIKDNIMRNQPEFQQDVIQGLEEGRIPRTDAAGMLGISEEELDAFIEKLRKKEERKQSLKIS